MTPLTSPQIEAMDDTMSASFGEHDATEDALVARLEWFDRVLAQNCMPATSRLTLEQRRNDTEQQLNLLAQERHSKEQAQKLGAAIYWAVVILLCCLLVPHVIAANWPSQVVL